MKAFLFVFVMTAISMCSCGTKYCWKCTTVMTTIPDYGIGVLTSSDTVCDKTEYEIKQYEKSSTLSEEGSKNGMILTIRKTTSCVKMQK